MVLHSLCACSWAMLEHARCLPDQAADGLKRANRGGMLAGGQVLALAGLLAGALGLGFLGFYSAWPGGGGPEAREPRRHAGRRAAAGAGGVVDRRG